MMINFSQLCDKQVINLKDGSKLGCVDDVRINSCDATISCLIIQGHRRFFGLFGCDDDIVIHWNKIEVLGEDAILVCLDDGCKCSQRQGFWSKFFN